jgi:hypothetical protein
LFGLAAFAAALAFPTFASADGAAVPLQRPRAMEAEPSTPAEPAPAPAQVESTPEAAPQIRPASSPAAIDAPMRTGARDTDDDAPPPRPRATATSSNGVGLKKTVSVGKPKFEHKGFTFDGRIGTHGCIRALCSSERHDASPGVRLDGFIGGNIRGFVDIGLSGGWGTFANKVEPGTNALALYGVNPWLLAAAAAQLGMPLPVPVNSFAVNDARLRTARVGPAFRVHFVPRGRMIAYVGTGIGYSLFRARYDTVGGDMRVDLHGFDVPIQAGIGAHVTEHVAIVGQFDFFWARYPVARVVHPEQTLPLPVRLLDEFAQTAGAEISKSLPHIWSAGVGVRVRI